MSRKIDYEITEYETYKIKAQRLTELGLADEAEIFETLANLCYEKLNMLMKIEAIYSASIRHCRLGQGTKQ